jgi:Flp pilus assembly protein TadG
MQPASFRLPRARRADSPDADAHGRSRGQVLVIFTLSILVFIGLSAIVTDVAWYWANSLRIQRAADAAALAGVVHLPDTTPTEAIAVARAEATKNGYTHNANGYTVTPIPDPANKRRLAVTISGPVSTYFANLFGITSFPASRTGKAEYVLPVPMGSPENYYGVGFYERRVSTVTNPAANTVFQGPTAESGSGWSNPSRARTNNESNGHTTTTGSAAQTWRDFGLTSGSNQLPNDPTLVIDRIEVELRGVSAVGTGTPIDTCRLGVELSWNQGSTWTPVRLTDPLGLDAPAIEQDRIVGQAPTPLGDWGPHPWTRSDFTNTNFRVRVSWVDNLAGCPATRDPQVDQIRVRVAAHTVVTTWANQTINVQDPGNPVANLASQGFWGAAFTPGGIRTNGDRYSPADIGYNAVGNPPRNADNPDYDGTGYDYTIELGGTGQVRLFDPIFCATGDNGHGGSYGAGDHWTEHATSGSSSPTVVGPVASTYSLYNAGTNLFSTSDDTWIGDLRYDPGAFALGDFSGNFGVPQNQADGLTGTDQDCASNPAHNAWVLPPAWSNLPAGFYRLNVNTSVTDHNGTIDSDNFDVGAENLFSIWVSASGGNAKVYGGGKMAAYTNLDAGNQSFYFAQIEAIHAGKTMVITLFDPGESSGDAFLRILSPEGDTYDYATFDWESNDGRSGNDVTEIQTSDNGALFDNKILTIRVPLPATYAIGDLDPNNIGEQGWWRIEYQTSAANDTTTWQVELIGNPVHLVVN